MDSTMEENRINSLLQEVCKKLNINVDWYEISDGNTMVTFQFYTDYGQDVMLEIELEDWNDTEEICDKLKKLYENFDVDYETYIWIGEDGHGKNGAPYHIQDILNDMENAEKKLGELYEEFMLKC
jgi:hypothetical protein